MLDAYIIVAIFLVMVLILCWLFYKAGHTKGKQSGYWKGRLAGWRDCENLVISRGVKLGYDKEKLWEDLIQ